MKFTHAVVAARLQSGFLTSTNATATLKPGVTPDTAATVEDTQLSSDTPTAPAAHSLRAAAAPPLEVPSRPHCTTAPMLGRVPKVTRGVPGLLLVGSTGGRPAPGPRDTVACMCTAVEAGSAPAASVPTSTTRMMDRVRGPPEPPPTTTCPGALLGLPLHSRPPMSSVHACTSAVTTRGSTPCASAGASCTTRARHRGVATTVADSVSAATSLDTRRSAEAPGKGTRASAGSVATRARGPRE